MNNEQSQIFDTIKNEFVWLIARWQTYSKLYGISKDRIDLLNLSAKSFFFHLQFIILDDIELFICKLLDPAKKGRNENLTLEQLLNNVDENLKKRLIQKLEELRLISSDIRNRRNKRLGHFDLYTSLNRPVELFSKASRKQLQKIIEDIGNFLNAIELFYKESTTAYDYFSSLGDAESLINCLKRSESYKLLEKQEKIEHGYWRTKGPLNKA